ncbi:MAG: hypothetical protein NZ585_05145 [Chloracidobacterium sp.]|nr:hypothetical protein [Chloracidobacterium sp.]MDW8216686.1 hypothetical protein [Acidobacteriota bacterium]
MAAPTAWQLYVVRAAGVTQVAVPAEATWVAVGGGKDCDIVVDAPDFPQLAFQIVRRPDGALWLYIHPARLWSGGQTRQATLRDSIFPLTEPTVIAIHGTTTRFVLSRRAELAEARALLSAAERAWGGKTAI